MDQELLQYLDERFGRLEQRLDGHDRQFVSVNERLDEVKRHAGVLVEGLRHDVQLLAEGFDTFINVTYARDQARIAEQFGETRTLIRSVYDELRSQR